MDAHAEIATKCTQATGMKLIPCRLVLDILMVAQLEEVWGPRAVILNPFSRLGAGTPCCHIKHFSR
jgi:hypothetical protein